MSRSRARRVGLWAILTGLLCPGLWAAPQIHAVYEPPSPSPLTGQRNLLLRAPVTASPHWSDRAPTFAVDGSHDSEGAHWAAENIPVWLTVDLGEARSLNAIRLWTYWGNGRYYQYVIEGSTDGEAWSVLADRRDNTAPATSTGELFIFEGASCRYVRVTFTHNSAGNGAGGHIVEIEGYDLPEDRLAGLRTEHEAWANVEPGLHGALGSTDVRYPRSAPPELDALGATDAWTPNAWRGEAVSSQLVLWTRNGASQVRLSATSLTSAEGGEIPASRIGLRFVRYVLADSRVVADVLDTADRLDLAPRSARPVWVSVDVPGDASPGVYEGSVTVLARNSDPLEFPVRVRVQPRVLPAPAEWSFHLDLWQNPYAIARYHRVEPWSDAHMALLEPHLRLLASAGQKCATTTILYQAWGTQTYDPYESMVKWTRRADGSWSFDYTGFDKYVELCDKCGISESINCYSMLPWTMCTRYLDEATGEYAMMSFHPGQPSFEEVWGPFLKSFTAHLRERGWLGKTHIAMDERPPELMTPAIEFLRRVAPELKIALAGSNSPELKDKIDDWCVFIVPPLDPAIARERIAKGMPTTFYVCCGPGRPNTFTHSPPAESAWMGYYAAAQGYSGLLRWAFDSYVEDPLFDTSYVRWPAGDCFMVYPGPRSSVRFERLREGIQAYEKIRILRADLAQRGTDEAKTGLERLDEVLSRFSYASAQNEPAAPLVNEANALLAELSGL